MEGEAQRSYEVNEFLLSSWLRANTPNRTIGKISDLAKSNAEMSDVRAFWNSDEDDLRVLREELQQLLPAPSVCRHAPIAVL